MADDTPTRTCEGPGCSVSLAERTEQARFCSNNCGQKRRLREARRGRVCARAGCNNSLDHVDIRAAACSRSCQRAIIRARNPEKLRAQEQASRLRNAERVTASKKAWYEANRERLNAESLARYYADPQRAAELARARYENDTEAIRARVAQYRRDNRDKVSALGARYRLRRADATVEVFDPLEVFERDGWVCGICKEGIDPSAVHPDPMMVSLDHVIPLSRGGDHSRANTQAAHLRCNKRKHARLPESAA